MEKMQAKILKMKLSRQLNQTRVLAIIKNISNLTNNDFIAMIICKSSSQNIRYNNSKKIKRCIILLLQL